MLLLPRRKLHIFLRKICSFSLFNLTDCPVKCHHLWCKRHRNKERKYKQIQFHQRYTRTFFLQIFQQSQNVTSKTTFVPKICTYNVDEIDAQKQRKYQQILNKYLFCFIITKTHNIFKQCLLFILFFETLSSIQVRLINLYL